MVVDGSGKAGCPLHSFGLLTIESLPVSLVLSRGQIFGVKAWTAWRFLAQPQSCRTVRQFRVPPQLVRRRSGPSLCQAPLTGDFEYHQCVASIHVPIVSTVIVDNSKQNFFGGQHGDPRS